MQQRNRTQKRTSFLRDDSLPQIQKRTPAAQSSAAGDALPDDWFDFKPDTADFGSMDTSLETELPGAEAPDALEAAISEDVSADWLAGVTMEPVRGGEPSEEAASAESQLTEAIASAGKASKKDPTRGKHASVTVGPNGEVMPAPLAKTVKPQGVNVGRIVVIALVAVCLLAGAGLAFAANAGLLKSEPEATLVSSGATTTSGDLKITVKAQGYDDKATPIMYRIVGTSSENGSNELVERMGTVTPVSERVNGSKTSELPEGTFEVVLNDLPMGSYTVSWSNSFLSDGSFYRVPEPNQVELAKKDVRVEAAFTLVSGATASAEDVKAAYDTLGEWLNKVTGEIASMRSGILELARANAETAASVAAIGGLDQVGKQDETASDADTATSDATTTTTTTTTDQGTSTYVDPGTSTDTGGGTSTDTGGGTSTDTGGDTGGGTDSGTDSGSDSGSDSGYVEPIDTGTDVEPIDTGTTDVEPID